MHPFKHIVHGSFDPLKIRISQRQLLGLLRRDMLYGILYGVVFGIIKGQSAEFVSFKCHFIDRLQSILDPPVFEVV